MAPPATVTLSAPAFRAAAHVTLAHVAVFVVSVVLQARSKFAAAAAARKRGDRFLRYGAAETLVADRTVANWLEWAPAFLALFWMATLATGGGVAALGWAYVATRALYVVLAARGGLGASGPKNSILVATVPSYGVLLALVARVVASV